LIPARAGLNAVAALRRRNLQTGTAILNFEDYMLVKKILLVTFIFLVALCTACSTATAPSGNTNTASNSNANIPPEFSTQPVTPSGNSTPGIPDANTVNMNSVPKGATPTPGIPDPKNLNKPMKPGATPTPGIPSPEELKKQQNRTLNNMNVSIKQIPKNEKELEKTINDTLKTVRKKP